MILLPNYTMYLEFSKTYSSNVKYSYIDVNYYVLFKNLVEYFINI